MPKPTRLPSPIPPRLALDTPQQPDTGNSLRYGLLGDRYDAFWAARVNDGGTVWSFTVKRPDDARFDTLDVTVSSGSFDAFADADSFFSDLARQRPRTVDQVKWLLEKHGFVASDHAAPPEVTP